MLHGSRSFDIPCTACHKLSTSADRKYAQRGFEACQNLDTRRRNRGEDLRKLDSPKVRAKPMGRQGGNNDSSLAWVGVHWQELIEHYPNRWVLVAEQKVAADEMRLLPASWQKRRGVWGSSGRL